MENYLAVPFILFINIIIITTSTTSSTIAKELRCNYQYEKRLNHVLKAQQQFMKYLSIWFTISNLIIVYIYLIKFMHSPSWTAVYQIRRSCIPSQSVGLYSLLAIRSPFWCPYLSSLWISFQALRALISHRTCCIAASTPHTNSLLCLLD